MKLLSVAAAGTRLRLDAMQTEAKTLLSELDSLGTRLQRAFAAVCIDGCLAYFNSERKRMLEHEKQAQTNASLAKLPAIGIYGLLALSGRHKANWRNTLSAIFREEPFGDIRVMVSNDGITLTNVSGIARERGMTVAEVVAYVEERGCDVLSWQAFEARTESLRTAVLKGEAAHLGLEEAGLQDIEAITTGLAERGIVLS